jgi:arabinan endo-1,5-alpha-L-arabinosidase
MRTVALFTRLLKSALLASAASAALLSGQHFEVPASDPAMARHDGVYYLFSSGPGINVWRSDDMKNWRQLAPVFAQAPEWTEQVTPGGPDQLRAPDIVFRNGRYHLYYSVSQPGRNASAIGVASNATLHPDDPLFAWIDHGEVARSVPGRDLWNAVHPNVLFDDKGSPWLTFGSFWGGIKLVRLADSMTAISRQPQEWHTTAARHRYWKLDVREPGDRMNGAVEAPFIFQKDGYYYNFVSWSDGPNSVSKIVVGRSRDVRGPFLDREGETMVHGGGSLVLQGNGPYAGIGSSAVYTFGDTDYLIAHARERSDGEQPKLMILPLEWDTSGWPTARLDGRAVD